MCIKEQAAQPQCTAEKGTDQGQAGDVQDPVTVVQLADQPVPVILHAAEALLQLQVLLPGLLLLTGARAFCSGCPPLSLTQQLLQLVHLSLQASVHLHHT